MGAIYLRAARFASILALTLFWGCDDGAPGAPGADAEVDATVIITDATVDADVIDAMPEVDAVADAIVADAMPVMDAMPDALLVMDAMPAECVDSAGCADGRLCVDGACVACDADPTCIADPAYGEGATCVAGACVACPSGDLGCACSDGECGAGACLDGTCVDCAPGALNCVCQDNGACDMGGRCENDVCGVCPAGEANCPCGANEFCGGALVCTDGVCGEQGCPPGDEGCPCDDGACAEGLSCGDDRLCRPCTPEIEGCPCDADGTCGDDLACDAATDTCEVPEDCADLRCLENQLCREPELAGELPRCIEDCADGFTWAADTLQCTPEPPPGDSCAPEAMNSIAARCTAENRTCEEAVRGEARCANCLAGHIEEDGACRAVRTCQDIDCGAQNRDCAEGGAADATCGGCLEGFIDEDGQCVPPPGPTCEELNCGVQNRACTPNPEPACAGCLAGFELQGEACVRDVSANCNDGEPGNILAACAAQSRVCLPMGDGADCGGCVEGFALSQGACVPQVLCVDLGCEALGRNCIGEPLAACGDCTDGFVEREGLCIESIVCADLDCLERGRACDGEPFAACGDCLPGTVLADPDDPNSACVTPLRCADIECLPGEFCIEGRDAGDAFCSDRACEAGEALREDENRCVACDLLCGEPGETGAIYPFTQAFSDNCVCETESGFYADVAGAIRARPCDADGDGWVRISAQASLESEDTTIRDNARCDLRQVTRVVFQNEYGRFWGIKLCEEGLRAPWMGECDDARPMPLYESVRNDDPVELGRDQDAPAYVADGVGRQLRASELNPLTKACVGTFADYNDNGLADISEHQGSEAPEALEPALRAWLPFTHFVELHRVAYVRGPQDEHGQLNIIERSRCGDDFPLSYADGEGTWWRQCTRNRPADFSTDPEVMTPVGYDFAQYNCDADDGTCPLRGPPTNLPTTDQVPDHGLCEVGPPFVQGGFFGMNHASQFRCVQVSAPEELPQNRMGAPQRVLPEELYNGVQGSRVWQFNSCRVGCPEGDPNCEQDCDDEGCDVSTVTPGGLNNPSMPAIDCTPVVQDANDLTLAPGTVGFATARYVDTPGAYERGCINEWQPSDSADLWKGLCPGYDANPRSVVGAANASNFGRLLCGCGFGYGGPECDVGCPERRIDVDGNGTLETDAGPLHFGGPEGNVGAFCADGYCPINEADPNGGRLGYWLCGDFSITSNVGPEGAAPVSLDGGGFSLRGGISPNAVSGDVMCEDDDCNQGWSVDKAGAADR